MKLLFSTLISFVFFFQGVTLDTVRKNYTGANTSAQNVENFVNLVAKTSSSDPVFAGYKAAGTIMQAKFQKGVTRKNSLYNGVLNLETVINKNPNLVELRLIRLSIQENLPKFIRYNKNISSDKAFIIKNYAAQNSSLKAYIKQFAEQSKSMTAANKAQLK